MSQKQIEKFTDDLLLIDNEIANGNKGFVAAIDSIGDTIKSVATSPVSTVIDYVFGGSKKAEERKIAKEEERVIALLNKKVAIINAFSIPIQIQELISFSNLAISYYKSTNVIEETAWLTKLEQIYSVLNSYSSDNKIEKQQIVYILTEIEKLIKKHEVEEKKANNWWNKFWNG